jgi:hypothetical protein
VPGYSRPPLFRGFEEHEHAYLFDTGQNSAFPPSLLTTPRTPGCVPKRSLRAAYFQDSISGDEE